MKKMKNTKNRRSIRNVRLEAVNNENKPGMKINIDFSGQKEFLMTYRHSAMIYKLLADGKGIDELKRFKAGKSYKGQTRSRYYKKQFDSLSHILKVADSYLKEEV